MNKTALIWGVTGQAGGLLSELLLSIGYNIVGVRRRTSTPNLQNLQKCISNPKFILVEGDITDSFSVNSIIKDAIMTYENFECYNLAAQSHVHTSFNQPQYTFNVNTLGVLNLLEAIRPYKDQIKLQHCSTSEMYGDNYDTRQVFEQDQIINEKIPPTKEGVQKLCDMFLNRVQDTDLVWDYNGFSSVEKYQDEQTPFSPMSPYAVAKVAAHQLINNYRKAYGLFASCNILFNYESEYRGENFLTQKVCRYVARLKYHVNAKNFNPPDLVIKQDMDGVLYNPLKLGNLNSYRDFTYGRDSVKGMYLTLQQDKPDDFVLASGKTHMIQKFVEKAFNYIGEDWKDWVDIDESLKRPSEVDFLKGDASKAKKVLGWEAKVDVDELIKIMVDYQYNKLQNA